MGLVSLLRAHAVGLAEVQRVVYDQSAGNALAVLGDPGRTTEEPTGCRVPFHAGLRSH